MAGLKGGWTRRSFVTAGAVTAAGAIGAWRFWPEQGTWNPCLGALPPHLASHELVKQAWDGLDPMQVWDVHAHLVGIGDTPSGIRLNPKLGSLLHPREFAQRVFFLNAGCAEVDGKSVDESYVQRMRDLLGVFPAGAKTLMYAFDRAFDAKGEVDWQQTDFYVPDAYVRSTAQRYPDRFEWVASIHPYRPDAIQALQEAKRGGARAVKWLPSAMGIDPASERCKPFYEGLARLDLPLISHAGLERAVAGVDDQDLGNPLKLRSALRAGVRVVVAHCASMGEDRDLDAGKGGASVLSFELFARLMGEREFEGRLFGDLSAITQTRRAKIALERILRTPQWHPRLLNGSDYPLPGLMPIFSVDYLVSARMIDAAAAPVLTEIRRHNVLLFDFVVKRLLRVDGKRLPVQVFETRGFFDSSKESRGGRDLMKARAGRD